MNQLSHSNEEQIAFGKEAFEKFEQADKSAHNQRKRELVNPKDINLVGVPRYFFRSFNGGTNINLWDRFEAYFLENADQYGRDDLLDSQFSSQAKRMSLGYFHEISGFINSFHPDYKNDLTRIGTDYGGWVIDKNRLDLDSVVYCAGCGTDISFDLGLIAAVGCQIHAFDPTPQSIAYVEKVAGDNDSYLFQPVGVSDRDGILEFYSEKDDLKGSLSSTNLWGTTANISLPVRDILKIFEENGHKKIDLLKLDIEGAEYTVIDRILESDVVVDQLCVEFDQPIPPWRTDTFLKKMRSRGLKVHNVERTNVTLIR